MQHSITRGWRASVARMVVLWLALAGAAAGAQTLRWATRGDAETLDPHALAETPTINLNQLLFDALVERDAQQRLVPGLAERWTMTEPRRWRFELRPGLHFQDGTPLDADDVVFSIRRAQQPGTAFAAYAAPLGEPQRIDARTIELRLPQPDPLLLDRAAGVLVMSRRWAEAHRSTQVPDLKAREAAASTREAMGSGRFRLLSREPGLRTVLVRNPRHWAWSAAGAGNVERVELLPIPNDATRVAALLSGEVDLVQDVAPQDADRLQREPGLRVLQAAETRLMFLGMDLSRDRLLGRGPPDRNPLKDPRVREALALAIDRPLLVRTVMHGRAEPTDCLAIARAGCHWPALESPPPADPARAVALLAAAGWPEGFELTLDCPTDRYPMGQATCVALVGQLARIGVRVTLDARPKSQFFPKVLGNATSFFLIGIGGSNADPQVLLDLALHSPDAASGRGSVNAGRFADPVLDRLVHDAARETDPARRQAMLADAQRRGAEKRLVLPLWRPVLTWATRANVEATVSPNNLLRIDGIRIH